ncbi:hypothetical protein ABVK25_010596 [Lepraria finkii]|uniref:VWFA domain-containing protein n=1 Tax=Lepraria finkii TaxID=1340010 RepID=A0ABR4ATZ3_9LECA
MDTTIFHQSKACLSNLDELIKSLDRDNIAFLKQLSPLAVEDELGRFKVWAGNIGALQSGRSSLDYRLRDAKFVKTHIVKLLEGLNDSICQATEVTTQRRVPYDEMVVPSEDVENSSSSSSSSEQDHQSLESTSELQDRYLAIVDTLDRLYKQSIAIRSSAPRNRTSKAASYIQKDECGNDVGVLFQTYAVERIRRAYPQATDFLVRRLGNAVSQRRRHFMYERVRRKRRTLVTHALDPADTLPPTQKRAKEALEASSSTSLGSAGVVKTHSKYDPSSLATGQPSDFTATTYIPRDDESDHGRSVVSTSTMATFIQDKELEIPPVPESGTTGKDFECPYCCTIVTAKTGSEKAWKKHVVQDLQPYICTYEECPTPYQLFTSREEWLQHVSWKHAFEWCCDAIDHEPRPFSSEKLLEAHMRSHHAASFTDQQLPALIDKSKRPSLVPFAKCPLCDWLPQPETHVSPTDVDESLHPSASRADRFHANHTSEQLQRHIGNHLCQIAILSLPHRDDVQQAKSTTGDVSRANISDLSDLSQTSLDFRDDETPPDVALDVPEATLNWKAIPRQANKEYEGHAFDAILSPFVFRFSFTQRLLSVGSERPHFIVPFERNSDFVGREDTIASIKQSLDRQRWVGLVGLGGIGKTQVAIEYCYRYRDELHNVHGGNVFWADASTISMLEQSYREIAENLKSPHLPKRELSHQHSLRMFFEWLADESHGPWLLVLDNLEDTESSRLGSIPETSSGQIIITTRNRGVAFALSADIIGVEPMSLSEAGRLLKTRVYRASSDLEKDESDVKDLCERLEGFPLAITQVAAFINKNNIPVREFLHSFDEHNMELLGSENFGIERGLRYSYHLIEETLSLSHSRLAPVAGDMLALMAYLDRRSIPQTLLKIGITSSQFYESIQDLTSCDLISREAKGNSFGLGRFVQVFVQRWVKKTGREPAMQQNALDSVISNFTDVSYENWDVCEQLYPHVQTVIQYSFASEPYVLKRATLLHSAALYEQAQGREDNAIEKCEEAYRVYKNTVGDTHDDTLKIVNTLVEMLCSSGKLKEADEMGNLALARRRESLGPEHPNTLQSLCASAEVKRRQGQFSIAKEISRDALQVAERVLGESHHQTLTLVITLARVMQNQGKYDEAETLYRRALSVMKRTLGEGHPDVARMLQSLATSLTLQGDYKSSEALILQALEDNKTVGSKHPDTLRTMHVLANILLAQGRLGEAHTTVLQTVEGMKEVFGRSHPVTLSAMITLTSVCRQEGRWSEASHLGEEVVEITKKIFGAYHFDTLTAMANLASVYQNQGHLSAAANLEAQVVDKRKAILGKEHPATLTSMANLASTYWSQGRWEEAEELNLRVVGSMQTSLGREHPLTLEAMNNLAYVYQSQGRWEEAEEINLRVVGGMQTSLGHEHPSTLQAMNNLAYVYQHQGRGWAALELGKEVRYGRLQVLGEDHRDTRESRDFVVQYESNKSHITAFSPTKNFAFALIIDDTASMELPVSTTDLKMEFESRWEILKRAVLNIVRSVDQEAKTSVNIHFLKNRERNIQSATESEASTALDQIDVLGASSMGGTFLLDSLEAQIHPHMAAYEEYVKEKDRVAVPRHLNVLVITDGASDDKAEVMEYLTDVALQLDWLDAPARFIAVQFVQIGDDEGATRWLQQIDNELRSKGKLRDIFDTTLYSHEMQQNPEAFEKLLENILLGAVTKTADAEKQVQLRQT